MVAVSPLSLSPASKSPDRIIMRHGVSGEAFEAFLEERGDTCGPRVTYCEGTLELMSPGRTHEDLKKRLGRLLEFWSLAVDIPLHGYGELLVKNKALRRAFEPGECYMRSRLGAGDDVPEWAIEVIWTSGSLNKLEICKSLKVGEAWVWRNGRLRVFVLEQGDYVEVEQSRLLPELDLTMLVDCMDAPTQHEALRQLEARMRR